MSRKTKNSKPTGDAQAAAADGGFQDRLMGMLEWLADKDPVKAARLIGEYLDDLAEELGGSLVPPKPAKATR